MPDALTEVKAEDVGSIQSRTRCVISSRLLALLAVGHRTRARHP
ncbi:MAG TPA: hypothetical protein VJ021_08330 [Thermoplasmata archaeon]|nr:hypothetical protein [Thermoplasmata archaeon]